MSVLTPDVGDKQSPYDGLLAGSTASVESDRTSQTQSGATVVNAFMRSVIRSASPARQVRHDDVLDEVKLRLVEDDPATGPPLAAMKRRTELSTEDARHVRVGQRRPRVHVEDTAEDLPHHVRRERRDIGIGRGTRRPRHGGESSVRGGARHAAR